jgi:hypothetical protein
MRADDLVFPDLERGHKDGFQRNALYRDASGAQYTALIRALTGLFYRRCFKLHAIIRVELHPKRYSHIQINRENW